jgi:hypothetical protein
VNKPTIGISYFQSLLWTALFFATVIGVAALVRVATVYVVHGDPQMSRNDVALLIVLASLMTCTAAAIGTLLVFTLPQIFQAWLFGRFDRKFGERGRLAVLIALPLTAVLTWYCYDYLTPSGVVFDTSGGESWRPYQHGISVSRYFKAMGLQALVTVFGLAHFETNHRGRSTLPVIITTLVLLLTVGVIWGYESARQQIPLL